jgi:methyl-accepting chemotaxis protein
LQKEKIALEIAMEQEQEFIMNRLTRQMDEMKRQSSGDLSSATAASGRVISNDEPSEELLGLRKRLGEMESQHQQRIDDYQRQIDELKREINAVTNSENIMPPPETIPPLKK